MHILVTMTNPTDMKNALKNMFDNVHVFQRRHRYHKDLSKYYGRIAHIDEEIPYCRSITECCIVDKIRIIRSHSNVKFATNFNIICMICHQPTNSFSSSSYMNSNKYHDRENYICPPCVMCKDCIRINDVISIIFKTSSYESYDNKR